MNGGAPASRPGSPTGHLGDGGLAEPIPAACGGSRRTLGLRPSGAQVPGCQGELAVAAESGLGERHRGGLANERSPARPQTDLMGHAHQVFGEGAAAGPQLPSMKSKGACCSPQRS